MPSIKLTAILICSLIPLIVGYIWYHPKVLGGTLAKLSGETEQKSHPIYVYLVTIFASLLIAMLIAAIFGGHADEEKTIAHGAFHGGSAAVFMGIPTFLVIALFEGKSAKYIFIHALYWFISFILMGAVIGYFG